MQLTNEEFDILSASVETCDPIAMLKEIQQWQKEVTSNVVYSVLDTVADIIIDNTTFYE